MDVETFINKWKPSTLKESSGSKEHFIDLCNLLGEPTPGTDVTGADYAFEHGAVKTTGASGWADVWKRGHFGWEYKSKSKDLNAALSQLQQYALALNNPPLLVVCDINRIRVHTNWTNTASVVYDFSLEDLRDAAVRQKLKWVMSDPDKLKPTLTRKDLTEAAAGEFADLALKLFEGNEPIKVAHFINRLIFCMFAEDVGLLPDEMFLKMLQASAANPATFSANASTLFRAMANPGGLIGYTPIEWFNGGLFNDDTTLPLDADGIAICIKAAKLNWQEIDPSIFGTLFERGMDPAKRSQLGAHYTDREKIMMIVEPTISAPLQSEWAAIRSKIMDLMADLEKKAPATRTKARGTATTLYRDFIERLRKFRVLDPACGSGNFLYVALRALKDIEHQAGLEAEALGLQREFPAVGPESVYGLEINPYAAELARVTVWIGEIQWMRKNGFDVSRNPILKPLDNIKTCNALLNDDMTQREWPTVDVVIGNPPFLGAKLMKRKLGVTETANLRDAFKGQLPGFTDLVCYWFEKSQIMISEGRLERAGLVATNSIRKGTNLPVLKRIVASTNIFEAWSEEKWTVEGASVDVSIVCFGKPGMTDRKIRLNATEVPGINPDLTTGLDLTKARQLKANADEAFLGIQKSGPFDVPGSVAREWMKLPTNPNGKANSQVLRPYYNGDDVTGRPRDMWLIDLPLGLQYADAALYEKPFKHLITTPDKDGVLLQQLREALDDRAGPRWWELAWPRPEMRSRIAGLDRYIVTPETAEHRFFVWLKPPILPDKNLIVVPRSDDVMFALLHSKFHEVWSLRKGSDLQNRPRYTHTSTFGTFPFPPGYGPKDPVQNEDMNALAKRLGEAGRDLEKYRSAWLNPDGLFVMEEEVEKGFPDRLVPKNAKAAVELSKRTMTNLYNDPPTWLTAIHERIDEAVAEAYGWSKDIKEPDFLAALLELNVAGA